MFERLQARLSYANVMATVAVFIAVATGGAYAVDKIGSKDIAKDAVRAKHIKKKQVRAKHLADGLAAQGPAGPTGPAGTPFDANATLRPGETLTGVWAVGGGPSSGFNNLAAAIQFAPQLPAALGAGAVHRIAPGSSSAQCPGQGEAAPGAFCLYERTSNFVSFNTITDAATGANGANRRGAVAYYIGTGPGAIADGTWAVTAP